MELAATAINRSGRLICSLKAALPVVFTGCVHLNWLLATNNRRRGRPPGLDTRTRSVESI
jgi:hypothetical protein